MFLTIKTNNFMKTFVDFYNKINSIHQEVVLEMVSIFKENNVTKVNISSEVPLILSMFDEWGEGTTNETITDVELETNESGIVVIKLYKNNTDTYFDFSDCADGNAILYVYDYVWTKFYAKNE